MFCCAFAATFALSAHADMVTFPNADNSGDLSSDAAWDNVARDATSDVTVSWYNQYNASKRTYTAKEDVSFASLNLSSGQQDLTGTFNMTESKSGSASRTITLSGSISNGVKKASATFLGGVWSIGGSFYQHSENTFKVADGAKMTFGGPYFALAGSTTLLVSGEGTSLSLPLVSFPASSYGGNALVVTNGASVTLTEGAAYSSGSGTYITRGAIAMNGITSGGGSRKVSVSGEGSRLILSGVDTFAWVGGVSASGQHQLTVSYGGKFVSTNASLYVSAMGTATNTVLVSGVGSSLVVTNISLGHCTKGSAQYGKMCGNRLVIEDGATVQTLGTAFGLANNGNSYRSSVFIGHLSRGNTLLVDGTGSSLSVGGSLYMRGKQNAVIVTNGTVSVAGTLWLCAMGYDGDIQSGNLCSNRLEIAGTTGAVSTTTGCTVNRESTLAFGVPDSGYGTGTIPLSVGTTLKVEDGSHIEISGIEERIKAMAEDETATLAVAGSAITIPDSVLEEANAALPGKCRLYVDGKSLKLTLAKGGSGMMIFVR